MFIHMQDNRRDVCIVRNFVSDASENCAYGQARAHTHTFCASAAMPCAIMARISRTVVRSSYHRKPPIVV